ncbi:MAG TPA: hypothetical protein VHW23_37455 [Kofleriaceae bacterium]|nr:hypothetical protein [Kofleriaceae bacterium]
MHAIERDAALCEALIAAGATVDMQLLHYIGPLPVPNDAARR